MQKIVLFDIDYTLIDVSYFHKNFYKKLSKIISIDESKIRELSIKIITEVVEEKKYLDIDIYLIRLLNSFGKSNYKKKTEELLFNSGFFKDSFYDDVEETLEALKKFTRIGIFSHGDYKFQWAKIEQSGFKDYFEKDISYIKNVKMDFLPFLKKKHLNDKLYLVDDNPSIIDGAKKFMPSIFTIWIKRGEFKNSAKEIENYKPDATVDNLSKIVEIIRRN